MWNSLCKVNLSFISIWRLVELAQSIPVSREIFYSICAQIDSRIPQNSQHSVYKSPRTHTFPVSSTDVKLPNIHEQSFNCTTVLSSDYCWCNNWVIHVSVYPLGKLSRWSGFCRWMLRMSKHTNFNYQNHKWIPNESNASLVNDQPTRQISLNCRFRWWCSGPRHLQRRLRRQNTENSIEFALAPILSIDVIHKNASC